MLTLTLTKLSETSSTITLGWTPPPANVGGYVFYANGQVVSVATRNEKDGTPRNSVRFSKTSPGPPFEVVAVVHPPAVAWDSYPDAQPSPVMLPGTLAVLDPGEVAAWAVHRSPTTEILGDGGSREDHRVVRWSPDGLYSGRRMVELVGFRLVEGYPGRFHDWHPRPGSPAWARWPAPFAIDFNAGRTGVPKPGMELTLQSEGDEGRPYHFQIMSDDEARSRYGKWTWLWVDSYMARRGVGPGGSCKIYLAGEDTPRVSVSNVNMHWAGEDSIGLSLWEGAYNFSQARSAVELAATRIGHDSRECFNDRPTVFTREPAGNPGGTATAIADVDGGSVPVPLSLRW